MFIVITAPVLAIIACKECKPLSFLCQLGDCYLFVAKILIMRCGRVMPTSDSGRIAFGSVILGGIVIFYCWKAMLSAYLNVRITQLPINTLSDLLDNPNYKLIMGRGTAHVDQFQNSTNPLYIKL